MYFVKQLIYFHARNVRAGKKQLLHFTIVPGNWPFWRSEILCEILSYSNASNAAPCSNFPGDIHTQCRRTECHNFSLHNCIERSKL